MIKTNSTLCETKIAPFMNTPSSRRQFVKKSALFAGAAVSLPRLSSLAAETNAPATAAPPPAATANAPAEPLKPRTGLRLPEFGVHDPWMLAEKSTQTYYLYTSAPPRQTGLNRAGTFAYKSRDLATWDGPLLVFACPDDCWAIPQEGAWAPEVHAYRGKYYLFTTLHNPTKPLPALGVPARRISCAAP